MNESPKKTLLVLRPSEYTKKMKKIVCKGIEGVGVGSDVWLVSHWSVRLLS